MNQYIFNIVSALWVLSEIYLNRFLRSAKQDKRADKNTELFIWIVIGISAGLGIFVSRAFSFPIYYNQQLGYIGIAMILLGITIRFAAIKQLGKYFTVDVSIRTDHKLMHSGFYKYLRHPSYAGSLLSFLGLGFSTNSWIGMPIVFVPVLAAFIHRMNVEEKVLAEQFGKEYTDYTNSTKRIVPFIY